MIALLLGAALASPCEREVVLSRGLVVDPPSAASVMAELHVDLWLRKRRVGGIPSWSVRKAAARWSWTVSATEPVHGESFVGGGEALCEGEERRYSFATEVAPSAPVDVEHSAVLKGVEACRVRVVLRQTTPSVPGVTLDVHGPTPPGPEAPVDGPLEVVPGEDLVIDIPGCL